MNQRELRRTLVANRGEIAVRLIRALRESGIESVAVYAQDDARSAHVRLADYAHPLDGEGAASYLDQTNLLRIARAADCDSVLPGYGFLSENAQFAQSCEAAGVLFIGPSPDAIAAMGDKLRARELMGQAGVPLVPGGSAPDLESAKLMAASVGYPVLLKAAQGGGGKGMRLVEDEAGLGGAYEQARSEASRAFGSDTVYVEKAVLRPRHVEIQVLADTHGNAVHLFERDCSIQRRHQKVIEESPSPNLPQATLEQMGAAALNAVKAVNYHSVGTLEFLLDDHSQFYFLEMNTRLQVEHAVTELVTGIDLVEQMIRVAQGKQLSLSQEQLQRRGCAIQCRVYAEDPETGFLPSSGVVSQLREPSGPFVRVDSCLFEGAEVGSEYDPLLAKVCARADDRPRALARMRRALDEFRLTGLKTNLQFLRQTLRDPDFVSGEYRTDFIPTHPDVVQATDTSDSTLAAALAAAADVQARASARRGRSSDAGGSDGQPGGLSPWVLNQRRWSTLRRG